MPGLVGISSKRPRAWAEPKLRQMVASLSHDPSYVTGTWIEEAAGIYLGWAVLRDSFCSEMPVRNESGEVSLFFAGEEYPEPDLKARLGARGHTFDEAGPDYLVHAYEDQSDFPAGLNGRFHGFVYDRKSDSAILFNDRYSMDRIHYHESDGALYFAAEAKAILSVCPELRRIDPRSLGEFLACGCVLENRTLFPGVEVMPPGSVWTIRRGDVERGYYFHAQEWELQQRRSPEDFYQELKSVFVKKLPRYFDGERKIGISLTGGLDTRMIMAWQKFTPGSTPCYSFGGPYRDCEDVVLARRVAEMTAQPYQLIPVGREFLSQFGHYAERAVYLTDGTVEVNRASDLFANEKVRSIAPVRMTGNYGSEVLRWVPAFRPGMPMEGLFSGDLTDPLRTAHETYAEIATGHPVSFAVFRQAPWHHYGLSALERTQVTVRTPYLDNDFVRTAFSAPAPDFARHGPANHDICLRLIAEGNKKLAQLPTDRGLTDGKMTPWGYLRHQYLEFTFKAEYAYDYGMPQSVAKVDHALSLLHLERLFLGRHKFAHYRVWYRDDLAPYVKETLLDNASLARPYLNKKKVESIVAGHTRGDRNYTTSIHKLLTLELIHRCFVDSQ